MRCGAGEGDALGDGAGDAACTAGDGDGDGDGDVCACAAHVPANAVKVNATSDKSFFKFFPSANELDSCIKRHTRRVQRKENRTAQRSRHSCKTAWRTRQAPSYYELYV